MSNIVSRSSEPDPKVRFLSIALAIVMALLWAVLIAFIWYFFRIKDYTDYQHGILNWIGRFHVIFLHIPVALIFLIILMEMFGGIKGFTHIRQASVFVLWITFVGSIGASLLGFLLMKVEGEAGRAMDLHMWTGLAVVVLSLFALIFKLKEVKTAYAASLLLSASSVIAAGHFGGALVHEADYLAEYAPEKLQPIMMVGLGSPQEKTEETIEEGAGEVPVAEKVVYTEFVHPILEGKCNECHNENKIKGKLRMDTHELLLAGAEGSDYPTVIPGDAEESEMIVRVLLDPDDDEFMPPKGDPLTPEETQLLKLWIQAGAKQETTVAELGDDPSIMTTIAAVSAQLAAQGEDVDFGPDMIAVATPWVSKWDTFSPEEQEARMSAALAEAEKLNVSILPVSAEDTTLRVNVLNGASEFGDDQLAFLDPIAENISWLNLAKSQVTDEGMKVVGKMRGLKRLHLENTGITDAGIAHLTTLKELEYLNIYGTGVSNGIFDHFKELPALKKVYVWQTGVDPEEARRYEESVNLEINTGVDLEKAAAEKAAAEEEARKLAEAEAAAKMKAEQEAAAKKKAEEEAARKKAEEAARKKREAELAAAAKAKADAEAMRAKAKAKADAAKAKAESPIPAPNAAGAQ